MNRLFPLFGQPSWRAVVFAGLVAPATVALAAAPVPADPANPPAIKAPVVWLFDPAAGRVLYARGERRRFVPASLTKIMTSYVAFELADAGRLDLGASLPMHPAAFRQWHRVGSTMFLENNSRTRVADLIEGIVTVSANDACVVLAEGVDGDVDHFTARMNTAARDLGMVDSHFHTPNGWMDEGQTYVSAADLGRLAVALIERHPALYRRFYGHETFRWNNITQHNHNPLYGLVAGADGIKTGFTGEAGYGLVGSVLRGDRRLIMVTAGSERASDRARDARALLEWGYAAFESHPLAAAGARMGAVSVRGGDADSVDLVAPRTLTWLGQRGPRATPQVVVHAPDHLDAPIAKGTPVATLEVRVPGQPVASLSLVAETDVARRRAPTWWPAWLARWLGGGS